MRAAVFERQGLDNLNVKEDVQQPTITDYNVLIGNIKEHSKQFKTSNGNWLF